MKYRLGNMNLDELQKIDILLNHGFISKQETMYYLDKYLKDGGNNQSSDEDYGAIGVTFNE